MLREDAVGFIYLELIAGDVKYTVEELMKFVERYFLSVQIRRFFPEAAQSIEDKLGTVWGILECASFNRAIRSPWPFPCDQ